MPEEVFTYTFFQKCYTFGTFFVGLTGGLGLGYLTKVTNTEPLYMISTHPKIAPHIKKIPNYKLFTGANNMWSRLALQGLGSLLVYSFLECKFQYGHRRTFLDSGLAGAITGAGFGLRGIPGGGMGAGYGAAGFGLYAAVMHLFFR